jgi:hypothetical protein
MLIYREIEAGYLTHTKDLISEVNRMRNIGREKWYRLDSDLTLIEIEADYLTYTKNLTPEADRMQDAGGEKWYRLDSDLMMYA